MRKRGAKKINIVFKLLGAVAVLAVIVILVYKIYGVSYEKYQINKKVTILDSAIAELGQKTDDLKALVGRLENKDYIEKEARKKLNFQKPGEQLVIITKKGSGTSNDAMAKNSQANTQNTKSESYPMVWYNMFFGGSRD